MNIEKTSENLLSALRSIKKATKRRIKTKLISLSKLGGSLGAFSFSLIVVLGWAACGPYFKFSDTWQLVINTGTTIITFLMAFSIQFTQNRDTKEITMILRSLMKQNKVLREQLDAIEQELDEEYD
ncbi:MAG: low affinity iron permease family protein [Alphaproteobacteria bacterium]|nr:low affinity iron permease family protein [Alphaproteobacteria bacterium]